MAHWSEDAEPLAVQWSAIVLPSDLPQGEQGEVYLLLLPDRLPAAVNPETEANFVQIAAWAKKLPERSVVCILTNPVMASHLIPILQESLTYQLWVAVKSEPIAPLTPSALPQTHLALLVLTRYKGSLRHTKTRIGYTYCPACGKTTKDYGGKKHTYHEYGTLMADVWRDLRLTAAEGVAPIVDRLKDVFGLEPYKSLEVIELRASSFGLRRKQEKIYSPLPHFPTPDARNPKPAYPLN